MTTIIRIPIAEATSEHMKNVCDNNWAGGYRLAATLLTATDVILFFQPKE